MMRAYMAIAILSFSLIGSINAQRDETLFGNNKLGLSGAWGTITYNYSFFNNDDFTYARGGSGGLEFGNTVFIGYGGYHFREDARPSGVQNFNLRYNGLILGVTPFANKVVHPRLAVLGGGGRVRLEDRRSDRVFVLQPSVGLEINVFQWFRIGAEGGYRFISNAKLPGISNNDISSPFAQLDLRFGGSWGR